MRVVTHEHDTSSENRLLVAILLGGSSSERKVSLSSGEECGNAIEELGHHVIRIDPGINVAMQLLEAKVDVVFNALHGKWGEDGSIQGILDWLDLPYTHSGLLPSALAMDKQKSKLLFHEAGVPVANSFLIHKNNIRQEHPMQPPYVVKPYNEGSSIGISIIRDVEDEIPEPNSSTPDWLMVEKYVEGHELTVAVLNGKALTVTEIISDEWYDFESKYSSNKSIHYCPAKLPEEVMAACMNYAEKSHLVFGCRGLTRTDFRWDPSKGLDGIVALELNTQPGMTPTSLAPEQAQYRGISFCALCDLLIRDAIKSKLNQ